MGQLTAMNEEAGGHQSHSRSGTANGTATGTATGTANGTATGTANGTANGTATGTANDTADGVPPARGGRTPQRAKGAPLGKRRAHPRARSALALPPERTPA